MKRRLLKLGLLLVFGAILNVAVAWGCAAFLRPLQQQTFASSMRFDNEQNLTLLWGSFDRASNFGVRRNGYMTMLGREPLSNGSPTLTWFNRQELDRLPNRELPKWSRLGWHIQNGHRVSTETEAANGWPLPALWCSLYEDHVDDDSTPRSRTVSDTDSAILLEPWPGPGDDLLTIRALPLIPIWPGFAINTIFYAAMLWMLFAAPGSVRRRIRARRGLCFACAYPIGSSDVCTECGKPVQRQSAMGNRA